MKQKLNLIIILLFPILSFSQKNIEEKSSNELIREGVSLHDNKKYFDAVKKFKNVSINDTNYSSAQYEMALSYIAAEEYFLAQKILKELLKFEVPYENRAQVYNLLGQTYDGEGKFQEAINVYNDGLKIYPKNHHLYYAKGITYEKFEKYQEAFDAFKAGSLAYVGHASSHLRLGSIAAREGHFAEALMCLMTFVLLEPESDRTASVVKLMEEIADGTYVPEPKGIKLSEEGDDFENINLFIQNQVALQPKYKGMKFTISTAYAKQFHLLLSNIKYNENDPGFWNTVYVPLYLDIFQQKLLDPMILFSLQSIGNESIQKKVKSKRSTMDKFLSQASSLWSKHSTNRLIEFEGEVQKVFVVYQRDGSYFGKLDDEGKATGNWYYYYPEGNLRITGKFDANERNGLWVWKDYFTLLTSEETEYKNGKQDGQMKLYYSTGELLQTRTYKEGILGDTITYYERSGFISEKRAFKDDQRHGLDVAYYPNGSKKFELTYKEGLANGDYESFHPNGKKELEFKLLDDNIDGVRKSYYDNGQQQSEFTYKNKVTDGPYKNWHPNGQLSETGTMKEGKMLGEIIEYYTNGKIYSKSIYDESGKENGTAEYYDYDGKKYQEYEYKKGSVQKIKLYNAKGELTKTIERSGKKIQYVSTYANGSTKAEGLIVDDQKSGKWQYFDNYGNIEYVENYKNGMLEDTTYGYFPNGKVEYKQLYKEGVKQGIYLEYNQYGTLITEGNYRDGEQSNDWYDYYNNGELKEEYSYKNGDRHGLQRTYSVVGKLIDYDLFDEGRIIASVFLDTNSREIQRFGEYHGEIKLQDPTNTFTRFIGHYKSGTSDGNFTWYDVNKKITVEGTYLNGYRDGLWKYYFDNGKVKKSIEYRNGDYNGSYKEYFDNGQLSFDATYVNGLAEGSIKYYFDNGKLNVEAPYIDGKRHGKVVTYGLDGAIQMIRFYDHGILVSFSYLDKAGKEVEPIKIITGESKILTYYQSGVKSTEQTRINSALHGKYQVFFQNGKVMEEETYFYGDLEGLSTEYYETGTKKSETMYNFDEKHGKEIFYYPNGKIKSSQDFLFGLEHGKKDEYNQAGKLVKTSYYYNDELYKVVTY